MSAQKAPMKYAANQKFGEWTLVSRIDSEMWLAKCVCGTEKAVRISNLARGKSRSCGCTFRKRHGHCVSGQTKIYTVWHAMIERCRNPNNVAFKHYGGRGISVCDRWKTFENFLADMGDKPVGMSIDRIDVNGNYAPGNCRWATQFEQVVNQRMRYDNTSGFKGVSFDKRRQRWMSSIQAHGKSKFLGYFDAPEEAYAAYVESSKRLHGEFANIG